MSAYTTAVAALTSLRGYWKLNETSSVYADSSGGGAGDFSASGTGTRGAAGIVPGDGGVCLDKTGTGRYGFINDNAANSPTAAITIMAWVQPTDVPSAQHVIYKLSAYGLSIRGTVVSLETGGTTCQSPSDTIIPNNAVFIAGTYDLTTMKVYVNGVLVKSKANSTAITDNANIVELGAVINLEGFVGKMQHIALLESAVTQADIQNLYVLGGPAATETAARKNVCQFSRTVVSANPGRTSILLVNDSDAPIYVGLGSTATLNSGVRLAPNGGYWRSNAYQGDVSAIHASYMGTKTLLVTENA